MLPRARQGSPTSSAPNQTFVCHDLAVSVTPLGVSPAPDTPSVRERAMPRRKRESPNRGLDVEPVARAHQQEGISD